LKELHCDTWICALKGRAMLMYSKKTFYPQASVSD